jgi:C4-dicarboxylate transporter DctM subunit
MGGMGIPEMRKRGYSEELATGLIAAGGTLGILIPPSLTLIIYGIITEQSIGKLFIAGVIPGILLAVIFALWVMFAAWREKQAAREGRAASELLKAEFFTWRQRLETLPRLAPFVVLIAVVMVALYDGWGTPSEVAGVGAAGSLALVVGIYGVWRWRDMKEILLGTARESCMIMMIIAMAFLFTYVMSYLHITQSMAQWLVGLGLSKWAYLFWVNVLLLVLGLLPAAGGDHPDGDAGDHAGHPRRRLRSDLVRHRAHHQHGDGPDHAAGGPQPLRHQRHRARHRLPPDHARA